MKINKNIPPKLPENLYHITTAERFEKIKKDRVLRAMPDTLTGGKVKGVFTFDLENFISQWTKDKKMNLARLILDYIGNGKELVALRIPLKNLPPEQLANIKARDVKKTIDWKFSEYVPGGKVAGHVLGERFVEMPPEVVQKNAIEHIMPEDIPIEKVDCLGTSRYEGKLRLVDVLNGFFKNYPEEKSINKNIDMLM